MLRYLAYLHPPQYIYLTYHPESLSLISTILHALLVNNGSKGRPIIMHGPLALNYKSRVTHDRANAPDIRRGIRSSLP